MSQATRLATDEANQDLSLVHGNLWRAIWVMSWPLLLTTICGSLVGLTDMYCAGTLGSAQQAAVGVSEQIIFMFMVFILSTAVGTTAIVSRAYGAGNLKEAQFSTAQSICFSVMMGLTLSAISLTFARYGVSILAKSPDVVAFGRSYLSIYTLFLIPLSVQAICNAAFRAIGKTKLTLLVVGSMTAINIAGDFLTVIANQPVPGLGIRGIAYSGVIASFFGAGLAIYLLSRSELKESLKLLFPLNREMIMRVVRLGIPAAIQRMGWSLSVFALFFILNQCPNPTSALASWTIGMRVEALVFMPLMALSLSVSSIVGQNLGAKLPDRAIQAGWKVTWIGIWMMVVAGAGLFLLSGNLAHRMTHDPVTVTYTQQYLQINSLAEPFLAVGMILSGALQGAGDTRTPMWISICSHWVIRMPVAWYLADRLHWGPSGAWTGMAVSIVIMAILAGWRFQSKAWLESKV
ncbi:MAG TPA: MATE family efflux transporter [Chroococcales cyanobacterium]